jgi:hypothetical protein
MFISGFVSGLIAQCEISRLLNELFGSLGDLPSLDKGGGEGVRARPLALSC